MRTFHVKIQKVDEPVKIEIQKSNSDAEKAKRWTDSAIAICAIAAGLISIIVGFVTHYDAKESLSAQLKSVDAQIVTSRASVAPVVVVAPNPQASSLTPQADQSDFYLIDLVVGARGQTPAIQVKTTVNCQAELSEFEALPHGNKSSDYGVAVLSDKESYSFQCFSNVKRPGRAQIKTTTTYLDVFHQQYVFEYCFLASPYNKKQLFIETCNDKQYPIITITEQKPTS